MTDRELGLEDFERLFTEAEPEELRRYVAAMRDRPAVHPGEHGSASAQAVLSRPSGLLRPPGAGPAPIDYVTSYLTLGEYMTVRPWEIGRRRSRPSTDQLHGRHPPEEMMKALAILDYATQEKEMADDIQRRFAERLKPEVRTRPGSGKRTAGPPREGERD